MKTRAEKQAYLELVVMALIWGYGFVAVVYAFESFSAMAIATYRFLLAFLLTLPFIAISPRMRKQVTVKNLWMASIPGVFLGLTLYLQTSGLQYTTATKSSFITTLYILWVPLLERIWLKRSLKPIHYLYVLLGLVGTALICRFQAGDWNYGDVLTLGCSITAAIQIVAIAKYANRISSPFVLNGFQSIWAAAICAVFLIWSGSWGFKGWSALGMVNFLHLAIFSSFVAFTIQVRAQKVLSAGVASMVFLLESPAGSFFAFLFLGETLDFTQWIGAALIFLAAVLVVRE